MVRRIYRMSLEGKGPYEIARIQSAKPIRLRGFCIVLIAVRKCTTIVAEQEGQEIGKGLR